MVRRMALLGGAAAMLSCGIAGVAMAAGRASAATCENNRVPYHRPIFLEVTVTRRRAISCKEALKIGKPLYQAKLTLPLKNFPPPPRGVPGGQGKPFGVSTPARHFTCRMDARGSDFIDADCHRGKHSEHVYTHRDCCLKVQDIRPSTNAASPKFRHCPNERIGNRGYRVSVWSISVERATCRAAHRALASAIYWRFALPGWNLNRNGVPTRWAPPGWRRCKELGLWVNARNWVDGNVVGSKNRCTGSAGRVLRFSWGHKGRWWVNEVGCVQSCPVTRTSSLLAGRQQSRVGTKCCFAHGKRQWDRRSRRSLGSERVWRVLR